MGGAFLPWAMVLSVAREQEWMGQPVEAMVSKHRPEPQSHSLALPSLDTAKVKYTYIEPFTKRAKLHSYETGSEENHHTSRQDQVPL